MYNFGSLGRRPLDLHLNRQRADVGLRRDIPVRAILPFDARAMNTIATVTLPGQRR